MSFAGLIRHDTWSFGGYLNHTSSMNHYFSYTNFCYTLVNIATRFLHMVRIAKYSGQEDMKRISLMLTSEKRGLNGPKI